MEKFPNRDPVHEGPSEAPEWVSASPTTQRRGHRCALELAPGQARRTPTKGPGCVQLEAQDSVLCAAKGVRRGLGQGCLGQRPSSSRGWFQDPTLSGRAGGRGN